ncbi:MAG: aminotransferase class I/II-fold pyridoxal phosphate-dependent enzyme [Legionella sp.]|uniref:aminotransferase class I/II-fold pyridoxal phosphate-dependent enzyme n=1 Tax=Legionella sp. TaxID=459 RepID=UPI0039E4D5E2
MFLNEQIKNYTRQLAQQGLLRQRIVGNAQNDGLIHFDSNDYLSLQRHKEIAAAYQRGYSSYPCGSGASMLLSGYHENHRAVEKKFADWLGVENCILFVSGYAANLALTALLGRLEVHCFIDKEVHASIYDGFRLAQVDFSRYFHNDLSDLQLKLTTKTDVSALITEGVFSMSGQMAPLAEISSLCRNNQTDLLVDEAHSFGVIGEQGKGAVVHHGLTARQVPLRVIPLGKAFASQGAVLAGEDAWITAILQAGRSLIYSTACSPALSYGLLHTLEVVAMADERRLKLMNMVALFRELTKQSPFIWADSSTPIQQLRLGCPHKAMYYIQELKKRGISCSAIRTPTVSKKETGLRVILNFNHTPEQLHFLFNMLNTIYESTS